MAPAAVALRVRLRPTVHVRTCGPRAVFWRRPADARPDARPLASALGARAEGQTRSLLIFALTLDCAVLFSSEVRCCCAVHDKLFMYMYTPTINVYAQDLALHMRMHTGSDSDRYLRFDNDEMNMYIKLGVTRNIR